MQTGLSKFQSHLLEKGSGGFIVTNPYNILYLSRFKGISPTEREAILTVAQNHATLITARLYQQEAKRVESKFLKVKIAAERNEIDNFLKDSLKNIITVGFEEDDLKYAEFTKYKKLLNSSDNRTGSKYSSSASEKLRRNSSRLSALRSEHSGSKTSNNIKLIATKNLIENLRIIKSASELEKIEKAQLISQQAFSQIIKTLKIGQTEQEIAHTLKSIIQNLGAEGVSFEPIIASGPNSGIPHHVTGKRRLTIGDTLLFDFGAKFQNYCADFSRTIFIGNASDQQRNVFNHVLTAQKKALTTIRHGIKHHEPFHETNNYFKKHKLDKYFTHGLGHGIGLEVHEAPYLRSTIDDKRLTNQMVFSVEPGLYFDWGGIRIEDLVTIQNGKVKVFGKLTKGLIEIDTNH